MKYETLHRIRLIMLVGVVLGYPGYYFKTSLDFNYMVFLLILCSVIAYFVSKIFTIRFFVSRFGRADRIDMLNYGASQYVASSMKGWPDESLKKILQEGYPKTSQEEINQLAIELSAIIMFCINIPHNSETYYERVSNQYSFLSKRVIGSLQGKAFLIEERGVG